MERYAESEHPRFVRLVARARQTNAQRDTSERADGWASPSDTSILDEVRTGLWALTAGLAAADWNAVAEGFVMLQNVESRMRQTEPLREGGLLLSDGKVWSPKFPQ